jgi:hypothetical protein
VYRKHITRVHCEYDARPYACVQCLQRFHFPKDLDRHQKTHEPRVPKFFCHYDHCRFKTRGFTTKYSFDRHMATHYRADSGVQMSRSTTFGHSSAAETERLSAPLKDGHETSVNTTSGEMSASDPDLHQKSV